MLLPMTEEQRWDSATLKVLINFFNSISLLGFSKIAHTCVLRPIERSHHVHTIETCQLPLISIKRFQIYSTMYMLCDIDSLSLKLFVKFVYIFRRPQNLKKSFTQNLMLLSQILCGRFFQVLWPSPNIRTLAYMT